MAGLIKTSPLFLFAVVVVVSASESLGPCHERRAKMEQRRAERTEKFGESDGDDERVFLGRREFNREERVNIRPNYENMDGNDDRDLSRGRQFRQYGMNGQAPANRRNGEEGGNNDDDRVSRRGRRFGGRDINRQAPADRHTSNDDNDDVNAGERDISRGRPFRQQRIDRQASAYRGNDEENGDVEDRDFSRGRPFRQHRTYGQAPANRFNGDEDDVNDDEGTSHRGRVYRGRGFNRQAPVSRRRGLYGFELPLCNDDGTFAPVQCSGSRCFCMTSSGRPLTQFSVANSETTGMHCGCALDQHDYRQQGIVGKMFRCAHNGNYDVVQCTGSVCYCTDDNGNRLDETASVGIWEIDLLNCPAPSR